MSEETSYLERVENHIEAYYEINKKKYGTKKAEEMKKKSWEDFYYIHGTPAERYEFFKPYVRRT